MPNAAASTSASAKPRRRWFQFSLRTLLIVTTLIACGCGWVAMKIEQARRQRAILDEIHHRGYMAYYDFQLDAGGYVEKDALSPTPAWLTKTFGNDLFADVARIDIPLTDANVKAFIPALPKLRVIDGTTPERAPPESDPLTDAGMDCVVTAKELRTVWLNRTQVTDAGLKRLQQLENLEYLSIESENITGAGLQSLGSLKQLRGVGLENTRITIDELLQFPNLKVLRWIHLPDQTITGEDFERFPELPQLEAIVVNGMQHMDAGLAHLEKFPQLDSLVLSRSDVTGAGLQQLTKAPKLENLFLGLTKLRPDDLRQLFVLKRLKLVLAPAEFDSDLKELRAALPNCKVYRVNPSYR